MPEPFAAFQPVALVAAQEAVVAHKAIEIALDLIGADVPGVPPPYTESLFEQGVVDALDATVGALAADLGRPLLDLPHFQQHLVRVAFPDAAEVAPVVGEDGAILVPSAS